MATWYLLAIGIGVWLFTEKASAKVKKAVHYTVLIILGYAIVFHLSDLLTITNNFMTAIWPFILHSANNFAQAGANWLNTK